MSDNVGFKLRDVPRVVSSYEEEKSKNVSCFSGMSIVFGAEDCKQWLGACDETQRDICDVILHAVKSVSLGR